LAILFGKSICRIHFANRFANRFAGSICLLTQKQEHNTTINKNTTPQDQIQRETSHKQVCFCSQFSVTLSNFHFHFKSKERKQLTCLQLLLLPLR
jgi:hypothetical protein